MPKYWLLLIVHKRGTSTKDTNSYIVIELNVPELAIYYVPLTVIKVSLGLWSPCIPERLVDMMQPNDSEHYAIVLTPCLA
jgi:hypothetical protein